MEVEIFNGLIHALVSSCPLWKLAKKKVTMNEDWERIEHKGEGVSSHTSKMQPQRGGSPNNCNIPSKNFDWSMFSLVRVRDYSWYITIISKWGDTQSGTGLLNEVYWRISTKKKKKKSEKRASVVDNTTRALMIWSGTCLRASCLSTSKKSHVSF